ncbi:MAG: GNAT family N-acetyltransferase [Verrucomicrobiaceae bacterium]|nr:MAG: GNAT family N-acetyltransferase [Verrucomicrobiaceae bacterium]
MQSSQAMIIRRYEPGEELAIWNVYFRTTHESNGRDYHPDLLRRWAPPDQDMGEWTDRLKSTDPWVAVVDGAVVGMAELESTGEIGYFYVLPDCQGQGVGSRLLEAIESQAREAGICELAADVSITAKDFFVLKGFRIMESRDNVIIGHPAPNFAMCKSLVGVKCGG